VSVNPDLWELDQRYMDLPGRDRVMLDLLFDYQSNVALYPSWHAYLRTHQPPALLAWGRNDAFFPEARAHAYLCRTCLGQNCICSTPVTSRPRRTARRSPDSSDRSSNATRARGKTTTGRATKP
jgi:hypothetical protein